MTDFNKNSSEKDLKAVTLDDRSFEIGWNSSLELAASLLESKFDKAFGKDTLSSIAIYIRSLKKDAS